ISRIGFLKFVDDEAHFYWNEHCAGKPLNVVVEAINAIRDLLHPDFFAVLLALELTNYLDNHLLPVDVALRAAKLEADKEGSITPETAANARKVLEPDGAASAPEATTQT